MTELHAKTVTHEELCDQALKHYTIISDDVYSWNSVVPDAIKFYKNNKSRLEQARQHISDFCNNLCSLKVCDFLCPLREAQKLLKGEEDKQEGSLKQR